MITIKIASIDIETTGLAIRSNGYLDYDILSFGCVLDNLKNRIPIKDLPNFSCYFVQKSYTGDPYALSMHAKIFRRIANREDGYLYVSPQKFGNCFKKFLLDNGYESGRDRVTINVAGKNFATLDMPFLLDKTDINKHVNMRSRILDPGCLMLNPETDDSVPGMLTCLNRAAINKPVTHDALDDAYDNIRVIRYHYFGDTE
jgi:oligoribonuclease